MKWRRDPQDRKAEINLTWGGAFRIAWAFVAVQVFIGVMVLLALFAYYALTGHFPYQPTL